MSRKRPMLRVGLTGGIASGKTTVAGFLAELGAFVLDADRIAHEAIGPWGAAHDDVLRRFGDRVTDGRGGIDRAALGRIVFRDPDARRDLEAIVHPRVHEEIARRVDRYLRTGHSPLVVVDAALLVESGTWKAYDRIVVLRCSRDTQIRRILARGRLSPEEAVDRIESQAPLEEKLAAADYVIDTDGTLRETRRQTEEVHASLLADFEAEFGGPEALPPETTP